MFVCRFFEWDKQWLCYSFPLEFFRDGIFSRSCSQRINMRTSFMLNSPYSWGCCCTLQKTHGSYGVHDEKFRNCSKEEMFRHVAVAFLCKLIHSLSLFVSRSYFLLFHGWSTHSTHSCSAMNQTITDTWNEEHLFSKFWPRSLYLSVGVCVLMWDGVCVTVWVSKFCCVQKQLSTWNSIMWWWFCIKGKKTSWWWSIIPHCYWLLLQQHPTIRAMLQSSIAFTLSL